ncbi:MAG: cobalamin biosynthesis protein CbiX [Armatimonadetes bacterium]|nr:MAG: cobalamin biosynthesis protein CbiX [Armatimonadota bacterium]
MKNDQLLPPICDGSECPFHNGTMAAEDEPSAPQREIEAACSIKVDRAEAPRFGVLLVNHGSHSATWRRMLLDVHAQVQDELLALPNVQSVRTGFMEYTEPSIAAQLRAFDEEGVDRILIVPLLLTISNHSFDDIPTICGLKDDPSVIESLTQERIERYEPQAEVDIAPLLDYPKLVRKNVARRFEDLRASACNPTDCPFRDGCVLVGYGSAEFNDDWETFFGDLGDFTVENLGAVAATCSWCGHIVKYKSGPTAKAIREILGLADRAFVIPILVAYDEMFQGRIIGRAIREAGEPERILYKADAILPEPEVERWVVSIVKDRIRDALRAPRNS